MIVRLCGNEYIKAWVYFGDFALSLICSLSQSSVEEGFYDGVVPLNVGMLEWFLEGIQRWPGCSLLQDNSVHGFLVYEYFFQKGGSAINWCTGCLLMWSSCSLQIIHTFFKSRLTFLTSDTVDGPSSTEKCIRLRHQAGNQGGGGRGFQKRGREHGSRGRGRGRDNKRHKTNEGDSDQPYDARGSDGWPSERPKFSQCVHLPLLPSVTHWD